MKANLFNFQGLFNVVFGQKNYLIYFQKLALEQSFTKTHKF